MSQTPDEIRRDIERTRAELGSDVDALAEKVTPSKVIGRQTDKVKDKIGDIKDRVFGAAEDTRHAAGDFGHDVADSSRNAVQKAKGNPVAVGLIALGAGALLASLIPASAKEKEVAGQVKEQAQPLMEEAKGVAKEAAEHLKEPAQEAAQSVQERATAAAEHVRSDAQDAAGEVRSEAEQARDTVQREQQRP